MISGRQVSASSTAELRALFRRDRFLAHRKLFAHRHEYPFAPFHKDIVLDFWSPERFFIDLGFRECGKTTLVEEALAIAACEGAFRNCIIVGAKESLAAELLTNVKAELDNNDELIGLYGDQRGDTWTQTKITLRGGYCIQAIGRDQSLRGTKHRDWRPDLVVINDFEDDEEILTPEGRRRTLRWILRVLLPACDRSRRKIRIYDTVRDPESVPMMLIKRSHWPHRLIPISYLGEDGEERSSWPGHPTLTTAWIAAERANYFAHGEGDIWGREYMMEAESQADRTFQTDMIKVEPRTRTFEAVYAMIDPARTVRASSATTGWAVWSWVRNRLIIWEAGAKRLMPDEIVDLAFRINREWSPVEIGVEQDGLNEWLSQPIRARMLTDGALPYRAVSAPRGKIDFIRGLQPYFASGEAILAADMPDLRDQLLGFPTGRIDAPNALAYALTLKPGRLIYEGWNPAAHVSPARPLWGKPVYLAANATRTALAAAAVQLADDRTLLLGDWVQEGEPDEALESVVREASMAVGGARLTLICAQHHWEQYRNVGLVQTARRLGIDARPGGDAMRGREFLRREMGRMTAAGPALGVSPDAGWTLRALAGGYSLPLRHGRVAEEPEPNLYRTLMEAVEALAGLLAWGVEDFSDDEQNFVYDADGRRYRSLLPARMQMRH